MKFHQQSPQNFLGLLLHGENIYPNRYVRYPFGVELDKTDSSIFSVECFPIFFCLCRESAYLIATPKGTC